MKAHITKEEQIKQAVAQLSAEYDRRLALESAKAGIIIGNGALQMAVSMFGEDIRNAKTYDESQKAALAMLEWCESKRCDVDAEDKKNN